MILSIGDLLLDITIIPDGPLRPNDDRQARIGVGGGGQAANFCAWAAALGEPVRLVTRVGDDDRGRRLVSDLEAKGVEVCPVWADEPTGAIAVLPGAISAPVDLPWNLRNRPTWRFSASPMQATGLSF